VRATLHWVSAAQAVPAEVRLYDHLFSTPNPNEEKEGPFTASLNPRSLEVLTGCQLEPGLATAAPGTGYQFERMGYFCADAVDSAPGKLVFNRTVTLRDTWAKVERAQPRGQA
jgi:glutaminyl-tRNA synthetase